MGANFHYNGMAPEAVQVMEHATPENFYPWLINKYKELSPDGPEHLPVVFEKIMRMWREEPALTANDLARIQAPTLVLVGDKDWVAPEHTLEMFRVDSGGAALRRPRRYARRAVREGAARQPDSARLPRVLTTRI